MTKKMKDTFLFQPPFDFYEIDFIEIEILLKLKLWLTAQWDSKE